MKNVAKVLLLVASALVLTFCTPQVDAQATIRDACTSTEGMNPGILTTKGTQTYGDKSTQFRSELRYSGREWHETVYDASNNVVMAENVVVAGGVYTRERNESGSWDDWTVQNVPPREPGQTRSEAPSKQPEQVFCRMDSLRNLKQHSNKRVSNTETRHFSASLNPSLTGGEGNYEHYEYWVDLKGRLIQYSVDLLYEGKSGLPEEKVQYTATYSNFSEPQVITAPTLP